MSVKFLPTLPVYDYDSYDGNIISIPEPPFGNEDVETDYVLLEVQRTMFVMYQIPEGMSEDELAEFLSNNGNEEWHYRLYDVARECYRPFEWQYNCWSDVSIGY